MSDGQFITVEGSDTYSLLQCRGCEDVRFLHEHWFSEDFDEDGPVQYQDFYPPKVTRQKPNWIVFGLPVRLGPYEFGELFDEIYRALGARAYRLATMGIRSLVEKMMIDKVGDRGSFEKNIAEFFKAGFVAAYQQDTFKSILIEAGHAAMHRDWKPSADEVSTLLDIVEGIVKSIYVDAASAEKVRKNIPPRQKRPN